jgi:hypothetical protein
MKQTWSCPFSQCKHKQETTSPIVCRVTHCHNSQYYELTPYKKERRTFKPNSVKTLKKECWDLFSEWIRRRYVMPDGYASCITCGVEKKWQEQQAGQIL